MTAPLETLSRWTSSAVRLPAVEQAAWRVLTRQINAVVVVTGASLVAACGNDCPVCPPPSRLACLEQAPPAASVTPTARGRIAFTSERDGTPQIYIMNADGSGVVPLTIGLRVLTNEPNGTPPGPVASPDGTKLAFIVGVPDSASIYLIDVDGTHLVRIVDASPGASDLGVVFGLAWSPDGKRVAFLADPFFRNPDRKKDVFLVNSDGSSLRNVTHFGTRSVSGVDSVGHDEPTVSWSPDGSCVAFGDGKAIAVIDTAGATIQEISVAPETNPLSVAWSADGVHLAFMAVSGEVCCAIGGTGLESVPFPITSVFVTNVRGAVPAQMPSTAAKEEQGGATWASDGTRLAYFSDVAQLRGSLGCHNTDYTLKLSNGDGGGQISIMDAPVGYDLCAGPGGASWSSDGRQLVYEGPTVVGSTPSFSDVFVVNADGTGLRNVTNNPAQDGAPMWVQ